MASIKALTFTEADAPKGMGPTSKLSTSTSSSKITRSRRRPELDSTYVLSRPSILSDWRNLSSLRLRRRYEPTRTPRGLSSWALNFKWVHLVSWQSSTCSISRQPSTYCSEDLGFIKPSWGNLFDIASVPQVPLQGKHCHYPYREKTFRRISCRVGQFIQEGQLRQRGGLVIWCGKLLDWCQYG